jgi:succinate dehydrogenase / fumarate reductase flavoprotein subunit
VAESVTRSAIERKESRGGHTRDDYPNTDRAFGQVNVVTRRHNGEMTVVQEPLAEMPDELKQICEEKA